MNTIKWYQSKVTWTGIVITILGGLPLVNVFVRLVAPTAATIIDAAFVMVAGVLTVIWRVWFTNTTIETPPPPVQ